MLMHRNLVFSCMRIAGLLAVCAGTSAQEGPGLGVPATPQEVAAWDLSIAPDGAGLPPGSGDAQTGADIYAVQCLACHGAEGAGQLNAPLAGGHGTLAGVTPVRTIGSYWPYATTVFDYIRRAMPFTQPQSLSNDDIYAVTAYLLYLNGIIAENDIMNADTLPAVEMPNRDGFIVAYPELPE
jgi:mono/diheme cytochrome c family protein